MARILILSDNRPFANTLAADIKALGYTALLGEQLEMDVEHILRQEPAVILFDLTAWDEEWLHIYHGLRSNARLGSLGAAVLVMVSEEGFIKLSPAVEFDDIILSPYRIHELGYRIKRLLRQTDVLPDEDTIKIDDLVIYMARYEVRVRNKAVELTFKEYELLKYLASHRGRAFSRESLLNTIWGYDYYGGTRTVDVHIRRIRAKIGDEEEFYIKTIRGVGYMFIE